MNKLFYLALASGFCCLSMTAKAAPPVVSDGVKMVPIAAGIYTPFFAKAKDGQSTDTTVAAFLLDMTPVTNTQYLEFIKHNLEWRRSQVKNIFAEDSYLKHWQTDMHFDPKINNQPVRHVSWFAAMNYCEYRGKELPSVLQWEYVGSADETQSFAIGTDAYKEKILQWYARPGNDQVADVGQGEANYWGVKNMHGLQWEWTLDFNTALVTGESREDSILDRNKFCGSGSLNAKDKLDYGAFMRFGFRSALKGNYTVGNLGFRCAKAKNLD
jgi:formylglycine-generating enzyme required for sulfatase activity